MVRPVTASSSLAPANESLQPAFQAINLEPEENVDEQIDTTKELHVRRTSSLIYLTAADAI